MFGFCLYTQYIDRVTLIHIVQFGNRWFLAHSRQQHRITEPKQQTTCYLGWVFMLGIQDSCLLNIIFPILFIWQDLCILFCCELYIVHVKHINTNLKGWIKKKPSISSGMKKIILDFQHKTLMQKFAKSPFCNMANLHKNHFVL